MLEKYHQIIIGLLAGLLLGMSIPHGKSAVSKAEFDSFKDGCGFIVSKIGQK